jgi:hypothetical protein
MAVLVLSIVDSSKAKFRTLCKHSAAVVARYAQFCQTFQDVQRASGAYPHFLG